MRIIAWRTLRDFAASLAGHKDHRSVKMALEAWYAEVEKSNWKTPADIKASHGSASILKDNRVVFNICGNKYRLVVKINYRWSVVYIRFIGSHEAYDAVDAEGI